MFFLIDSTANTRQIFCEEYGMDYIHNEFATLSCVKIIDGEVTQKHQLLEKNGRMYLVK